MPPRHWLLVNIGEFEGVRALELRELSDEEVLVDDSLTFNSFDDRILDTVLEVCVEETLRDDDIVLRDMLGTTQSKILDKSKCFLYEKL